MASTAIVRRLRAAGIAVLALGLVGLAVRYLAVPVYRPALQPGELLAVDVSNHQREIDWQRVRADGVGAAMIKSTEGRGWVDPFFARNWAEARRAGVRTGAYHFFTVCAPGAEQAANFLRTAPPDPAALAPAIDLELIGSCTDRPSQQWVDTELTAFVTAVEAAWGRPLVVYARNSFTSVYQIAPVAGRPEWTTSFFLRPGGDWRIWQVQFWARVDGISGGVDLDVLRPTGVI